MPPAGYIVLSPASAHGHTDVGAAASPQAKRAVGAATAAADGVADSAASGATMLSAKNRWKICKNTIGNDRRRGENFSATKTKQKLSSYQRK